MGDENKLFRSIILAGERPGGNVLSHAFSMPASVLVPVAGKPCLQHVMDAIKDSKQAQGGIICGPAAAIFEQSEQLQELLQHPAFQWLAPAMGPAASALASLEKLDYYPALLTSGDHALLNGEIVDDFCAQAYATSAKNDFIIGFVPHALVRAAWPKSRRTILKFSSGWLCGSNLFAVLNPNGQKALSFWRQAEADRKQPWRMVGRFGLFALLRYLLGRLTVDEAMQALSKATGCRVGCVQLDHARAAVDVDSIEDQLLAEQIFSGEGGV